MPTGECLTFSRMAQMTQISSNPRRVVQFSALSHMSNLLSKSSSRFASTFWTTCLTAAAARRRKKMRALPRQIPTSSSMCSHSIHRMERSSTKRKFFLQRTNKYFLVWSSTASIRLVAEIFKPKFSKSILIAKIKASSTDVW